MKVKINQIELTNFRNIDHAIYDLNDVCVIEGQNHIGKTNIMLAAYWCLTDKMLDGRSDSPSVKPLKDTSLKVSVKLTLDCDGTQHTIQKLYSENWTKKRGSEILSLTGHSTDYVIDDIKIKSVNEALKEVANIIGIDPSKYFELNKIDMVQALMNPYYFGSILEWKHLRELITKIIGDVVNEDVYAKEESTLVAKDLLERYNYDFSKALTFINQQISECTASAKAEEIIIDDLSKCDDLPEDEVNEAQIKVGELNEKLKTIKTNGALSSNPEIEALQSEINDCQKSIDDETKALETEYNQAMEKYTQDYSNILKDLENARKELNQLDELSLDSNIFNCEAQIKMLVSDNENKEERRKYLLNRYHEEADKQCTIVEHKCPNCGFVENADEVAKAKESFETNKKNKLDTIVRDGKALKLEIENNTNKIVEAKQLLLEYNQEKTALIEKSKPLKEKIETLQNDLNQIAKPVKKYSNENIEMLKTKMMNLHHKVEEIKARPNPDAESQRTILEQAKSGYEEKLAKHYAFIENRKNLENHKAKLQQISRTKLNSEMVKEALNLFSKTKLSMLDEKLDQAFGDVKFVLIQTNISEGSWNQVCYPQIVGTDTPFVNGSPSEKITTGIKIIEAFKKLLNLNDLPILVDEIGQLDNLSIEGLKLFTNAQIISTRVSNNYSSPKVVNI